jgi:chromosomal replication initiator protein
MQTVVRASFATTDGWPENPTATLVSAGKNRYNDSFAILSWRGRGPAAAGPAEALFGERTGNMPAVVDGIVEIPLPGRPLDGAPAPGTKFAGGMGSFIAGPENRLVGAAVAAVLDGDASHHSPLVIYGPAGTGKSHLALGLVSAWKARYPQRPAVYACAVDFARGLADAIDTQTTDEFSLAYRNAALLVIEDLQHLAGKQVAQEELVATLNAVADRGGWVVLTSSMRPTDLPETIASLVSRFVAGLTVPLAPPGQAAREVLVDRLAGLRGTALPTAVTQLLANELEVTAPGLLGAIVQLEGLAATSGEPISVKSARRALRQRSEARRPSLRRIAVETARQFSLRLSDLRGPSRRRTVVTARDVATYLARNLTGHSLQHIGAYFGGRDHTTISHGCRKLREQLEREPALRQSVLELQERL